jgi:hypothetical protein
MGSKGRSQLMNQEMDVEVDGDWDVDGGHGIWMEIYGWG